MYLFESEFIEMIAKSLEYDLQMMRFWRLYLIDLDEGIQQIDDKLYDHQNKKKYMESDIKNLKRSQ